MHDPIIIPVTQEETKAELRSRGYSLKIPPPPPPVIEEPHEPVIEHHEPPPPPPPPPIIEHHEPIPLPIPEADDHTQLIAGIIYAAFCVFIDDRYVITFDW